VNHGPWKALQTEDGSWTLVESGLGQACHAREGAWTEARERYAGPTRLRERALAADSPPCLRLLDVGTGLGWNIAAALEALRGTGCALEVVTLERDRRVIEACLELRAQGPLGAPQADAFQRPVAAALAESLADLQTAEVRGVALPGGGRLHLWLGDGRETLANCAFPAAWPSPCSGFDAVFLDPFSPGVDPSLWEAGFLGQIAARMAPGSLLSTYSASARVRARLMAAGLVVGLGPRVGAKAEGTLASPDLALPGLDPRREARLARRASDEFEGVHGREGEPEMGAEQGAARPAGGETAFGPRACLHPRP
jgi:tRNA U34 5-methylaminomethyl-2-thiouridine-forming methyltransferase MnmC